MCCVSSGSKHAMPHQASVLQCSFIQCSLIVGGFPGFVYVAPSFSQFQFARALFHFFKRFVFSGVLLLSCPVSSLTCCCLTCKPVFCSELLVQCSLFFVLTFFLQAKAHLHTCIEGLHILIYYCREVLRCN